MYTTKNWVTASLNYGRNRWFCLHLHWNSHASSFRAFCPLFIPFAQNHTKMSSIPRFPLFIKVIWRFRVLSVCRSFIENWVVPVYLSNSNNVFQLRWWQIEDSFQLRFHKTSKWWKDKIKSLKRAKDSIKPFLEYPRVWCMFPNEAFSRWASRVTEHTSFLQFGRSFSLLTSSIVLPEPKKRVAKHALRAAKEGNIARLVTITFLLFSNSRFSHYLS